MKVKLLYTGLFLLLITGFTACKKETGEDRPLRAKIIGKWKLIKFETTDPKATTQVVILPNDYMDFKDNENDDFELSINGVRSVGSFTTTVNKDLYLDFTDKDVACGVITATDKKLEFKGRVANSNPEIIETYVLSR